MNNNAVAEDLTSIVVDLGHARQNSDINESFLSMFGGAVKEMLRRMFGDVPTPEQIERLKALLQESRSPSPEIVIKGTPCEIDALKQALSAEKEYILSYVNNGVTHQETMGKKHILDDAVRNFEETTGLKWPIR